MPQKNGGISFLLRPTANNWYDFWVYICPFDAEFSSKVAVNRLRYIANSGTAPWSNIVMNGEPLIDLLIIATVSESVLPTSVGNFIDAILEQNLTAEIKRSAFQNLNAKVMYEAG